MSHLPQKPKPREISVHRRVVGSAPEIGKINRMTSEPRRRRKSKAGSSRGSSRHRRRSSRVLINWLVLVLSITGLGFGYMLLWSFFNQKEQEPVPLIVTNTAPSLSSEQALAMANSLFTAQLPEDLEAIMRPGVMSAQDAINYLHSLREKDKSLPQLNWVGTLDSLSVPVEYVAANFPNNTTRTVLFTPNVEGEWKLDFDAFAQLCDPDFPSLLDEGEQEGLVRVQIVKDSYFNNRFGDESEWDCYLLTHQNEESTLFGYCKRGSNVHAAMDVLHQRVLQHASSPEENIGYEVAASKNKLSSRATLYLKRPPGAEIKQFEITHVISDDWVVTDKPFDEQLAEGDAK